MPPPNNLKTAHGRQFPQRAFYPSSIRPTSRDVMDAAFLNWVFGTSKSSDEPEQIRARIHEEILRGDRDAQRLAIDVMNQVLFGQSEGYGDKTADTLRITHPSFGRYYRPKTYDVEMWANSLFAHAPLAPKLLDDLSKIVSKAEERPRNVFENAVLSVLTKDGGKPHRVEMAANVEEGAPPFGFIHSAFGSMVNKMVTGRRDALESSEAADELLSDVRRLTEVFVWIYWVQLHSNANQAIQALRANAESTPYVQPMLFGYHTETRNLGNRAFAEDAKSFPNTMYNGSIALNALTAIHQATGWKKPLWFDGLVARKPAKDELKAISDWLQGYQKHAGLPASNVPLASFADATSQIFDHIRLHYQPKEDNEKYPFTVGYGVARDLGQADTCFLMRGIGKNRGQVPMVDLDLVLLFARATAGQERRVRLVEVFEQMRLVGITFDEISQQEIRIDLEIQGRVRALSDSGEALYVEVR